MLCLFIRNSCDQSATHNLREEKHHWTRPDGGDGGTLLVSICSKNSHGTRASEVVAKVELLSMRTKDFQHNIHSVNKSFLEKEREITFGGEDNLEALLQLFQTCESRLVPRF